MRCIVYFSLITLSVLVCLLFLSSCGDDGNTILNTTQVPDASQVPELTTMEIGSITLSGAECTGFITDNRGDSIEAFGVCYGTTLNPTILNQVVLGVKELMGYRCVLTDLSQETTYYIRAFATTKIGTGYGNTLSFTTNGTVTDIDGNVYLTVKIGDQWWMKENLRVTHYRNGEPIVNGQNYSVWVNDTIGAYSSYPSVLTPLQTYGRLYNFYAASNEKNIAPEGWHVSTVQDWRNLAGKSNYQSLELEEDNIESAIIGNELGGKLKEAWYEHWNEPNSCATNATDFTALAAGYRHGCGGFYYAGVLGMFWTSEKNAFGAGTMMILTNDDCDLKLSGNKKIFGYSVRCVKD